MRSSDDRFIRLIAIFKLIKAALLIAVGVSAFKLMNRDIGEALERWVEALKLDPGNHFLDVALGKASTLGPQQVKHLGIGSFIYAALFLSEGVGLWLKKRWAEWLTIIITSSLIPLEIYELYRHFTGVKVGVLILNIGIVVYLVVRIRSRRPS